MRRLVLALLVLSGCGAADCRDGQECPKGEFCTRKITEQAETIWRCE